MANDITEKARQLDQLGLPPMELAESTNEQSPGCLQRCVYPTLQKIFLILSLITFSAGTYVLVLTLLDSTGNNTHHTEIIVVTGLRDAPNITLHKDDMDITFQLNNYSESNIRKKRSVFRENQTKNIFNHLTEQDRDIIKDMIILHRDCFKNSSCHIDHCKVIIRKVYSIIYGGQSKDVKDNENQNLNINNDVSTKVSFYENSKVKPRPRIGRTPNTENCKTKQSHPHAQEVYDPAAMENVSPTFDHPHSHMRYFQPSVPLYMQNREMESQKRAQHPQDFNLIMNFLQNIQRPDINKSSHLQCPSSSIPCNNNEKCVKVKQWCDGKIDCWDASDEIGCSCKSRVDTSRHCDGYFDCPFGEDELGCFGCSENMFSCTSSDMDTENKCFSKQQRCDGVGDCSNHKDENECNMLAPSLNEKPLFEISNTEGYLHRNFRGDWYAACENPYMWAHDACRQETGLINRPPIISLVPIDPLHKVKYLNVNPSGFVKASDTCSDSSAVYVTCPAFLCGTRVHTTSQLLLHENDAIENQIFGRNKRFLISRKHFNPYPWYFRNRKKRNILGFDSVERKNTAGTDEDRNKRAEARVVGGKPSRPAAWPWMVAIFRDGSFLCGGSIITQSWVISAAHCVHRFWEHYYEIEVGMLRRLSFSPQEHYHRVTNIIVNHHYNKEDMAGDLSLLKVEPEILFSRWARPICLPGPHTAGPDWMTGPAPNTMCTAVGWGAIKEHGPDPDHMREVDVPIWKRCIHREDRAGNEICAGLSEGGKDACQGDSGGPLLCRNPLNSQQWYLAGIVSHGDGCARKNEPGVYTRVGLFVKWIKHHITSKSLPHIQPLQTCPGFKCGLGTNKCLPNSRRCDKVVDCLDAQDEIDCNDIMRSSNDVINSKVINTTSSEKIKNALPDVVNPKLIKTSEKAITLTDETETSINSEDDLLTSTEIAANTDETNIDTELQSNDNKPFQSTSQYSITNESPDFAHASTLEISPTNSFEVTMDSNKENVAFESTTATNDKTTEMSTQEIQTITLPSEPVTLESRSVISEKQTPFENTEKRSTRKSEVENNSTTLPSVMFSQHFEQSQKEPSTTQKNRGDSIPDEETVTDSDVVSTPSNGERKNETDPFIIELLPTNISTNTLEPDKSPENNASFEESNSFKNHKQDTESLSSKNLPDIEDNNDLIHKTEAMPSIFSDLQPANIRKKHLVPNEFVCQRIFQTITFSQRCDRKVDCEDGTDELDCSCTDYLSTYDEKLICDGIFDCADGQDEINCFSCPGDHFLCQRSKLCVPLKYVCDGNQHCPMGEDELNCFALTNGREMEYDIDEKPKANLEGFLTKRNKNDWQVVCEETITIEQQELSANNICHYLGFSSANKYLIKHINVKDEDIVRPAVNERNRSKRGTVPVHFAYTSARSSNETARNVIIKEPQLLKEECVPNVTKTCKSLYVYCTRSLFTNNFETSQDFLFRTAEEASNDVTSHMWPWIAKVFIEGEYRCTGILIELAWVLVSDSCLWDSLPSQKFITVILGSHRTLDSTNGFYEKILQVDAKKDLPRGRVILLHLKKSAEYSNMVKPMKISSLNFNSDNNTVCVAIGQDNNNNTISIFVNETNKNCKPSNRCFERQGKDKICKSDVKSHRYWSGLISCHNEQGWYPASSFVESRGECELVDRIAGTDIENLIHDIKYYSGKELILDTGKDIENDKCEGVRCSRGRCVPLLEMCDGVKTCEDGNDESENSCKIKKLLCNEDPYHRGCECSMGEMKCKNGKCISKKLFKNGEDDCGDETDEPNRRSSCSDFLARVMPSRLCDGIVHCEDRSDEEPMFCKCFSKQVFRCDTSSKVEHCVAPDMVCDGVRDCDNGEDERSCIGLSAPDGTAYGTGQVMVCSHGVWHSKCYPTQNHTKTELEAICRELGFISGHAKEIKDTKYLVNTHNKLLLEPFQNIILNNQTSIKMRNIEGPVAKAVFDVNIKNCHPVIIECL